MTHDRELFMDMKPADTSKVRMGIGELIAGKGRGTVAIPSCSGTKFITDVPEIDQNLLSVGQLIKRGFKVTFKENHCLIKDAVGQDMFKVKTKGKSFTLNPLEEEQAVF